MNLGKLLGTFFNYNPEVLIFRVRKNMIIITLVETKKSTGPASIRVLSATLLLR